MCREEDPAREVDRLPIAQMAIPLPGLDHCAQVVEQLLLGAAAPHQQVWQQQLRVDLDDLAEERIVTEGHCGIGYGSGDTGGRRGLGVELYDARGQFAGHEVGDEGAHVGPAAIDGHARHTGAPCDIGDGGASQADGRDAVAGGIEKRFFGDSTVTNGRHVSHFNIMDGHMHWSRWGDPEREAALPDSAEALLQAAFGDLRPSGRTTLNEVRLAPSRLSPTALAAIRDLLGERQVSVAHDARVRHTRGRSTTDLVMIRTGDADAASDAVATPGTHGDVVALLRLASEHGFAVVPYGGGTSVVGGLGAGHFGPVVAIDLSRLDRLVEVDAESLTATLEAGVRGPDAEAMLGEHGLTLGHFPQSFEYASIGGFAATRSSGQSSSGYGRFDQMVVGLTVATPQGTWHLGSAPASAAGPDLRQLVMGSEGALGIITQARVAVRAAPEAKVYEGWRFASFDQGRDAMRRLMQDDGGPTVLRLSDETETALNLADPASIGQDSGGGVLMICGYEGRSDRVRRMRGDVRAHLTSAGGVDEGEAPGQRWAQGRFDAPYLRDTLLDHGVFVETLETATFWSGVGALYSAVKGALEGALRDAGANPIVLCHISHSYRTGASLYFTVAFDSGDNPVDRWTQAKRAASDTIVTHGATITHHHGVGRDHKPWYAREIGPVGVAALRALKSAVDPDGVLNPGVLIPEAEADTDGSDHP